MKIRGIGEDLLRGLLATAKEVDSSHGREFVAVLREEDGVIREYIFLPFESTPESAHIHFELMPLDTHIAGSAHSHPNGVLEPSTADLRFFPSVGRYHLILGPPYDLPSWRCFTADGSPFPLEVVP